MKLCGKIVIFASLFFVCPLVGMKRQASQMPEESPERTAQKQKIEKETEEQSTEAQPMQEMQPAAAASASAMGTSQNTMFPLKDLPNELQVMILGFLTQAEGDTNTEKLINAANNIRNAMSIDKNLRRYFDDIKTNRTIIREVASRYADNNRFIAALALHTRGGMRWLHEYAQDPNNAVIIHQWLPDALHFAVDTCNSQALAFLLRTFKNYIPAKIEHLYPYAYQDPSEYSDEPITLLMLAARKGCNQIIDQLLNAGALVNSRNRERSTALMYAAYYGHADTVLLLFNRSANINARNNRNQTAFILAGFEGHEGIVRMLLLAGAPLGLDAELLLTYAASEGFIGIMKLLLAHDVDINYANPDTPLMAAAENGQLEAVQLLLQAGADVNIQEEDTFDTALILAARAFVIEKMGNYIEIVRLLIQAHAKVDDIDQEEGATPLIIAASEGSNEIVKLLLQARANINKRNRAGHTALMLAARNGHAETVKILIDAGAEVMMADIKGNTALHFARASEHPNKPIIIGLLEEAMQKASGRPLKWIRSEIEKKGTP